MYAWLSEDDLPPLEARDEGISHEGAISLEAVDASWVDRVQGDMGIEQVRAAPVSLLTIEDRKLQTLLARMYRNRGIVDSRGGWLSLTRDPKGAFEITYSGSIFDQEGTNIRVGPPKWVDERVISRLDAMDVLHNLPAVSDVQLKRRLTLKDDPIGLAVYDVGQGSCAALVDEMCRPMIYFDVGGGYSYPEPMRFCVARAPAVVLSHWDRDHWYSLTRDTRLLRLTWIVPRQPLAPRQSVAAAHILSYGRLYVWDKARIAPYKTPLFDILKATGTTMNDSGLAVIAHLPIGNVLLPGDADYRFIATPNALGALVATHHGAKFAASTRIPNPVRSSAPLVFSCGTGGYGHPHTGPRHGSAGWNAQFETRARAGTSPRHFIIGPAGVRTWVGCVPGTCRLGDLERI